MKSRIQAHYRFNKKQRSEIYNLAKETLEAEQQAASRRLIKLVCVALYEDFNFGKKRISQLLSRLMELSEERETDEIFWYHVDNIAINYLGLDFEPENYNEVDR